MNTSFRPRGWHFRGYLPHFDGGQIAQTITFRLADSLPNTILARWERELSDLNARDADIERRKRIESYLDKGLGSAWMRRPEVANVVENALLHFDGMRYKMPAWVIMPNHVHALLIPLEGFLLEEIVHSWKSFTAKSANRTLKRSGQFWQAEYYDRYIRNGKHYLAAIEYIEQNPVKACLCQRPQDWPFSSARIRRSEDAGKMPALPGKS